MKIELTPQSETELKQGILELVEGFLENFERVKPRVLGLITAQQVQDELGIKYKTLQRWEKAGLRRYQPPLEDTRKNYYLISDVLIFLGVDDDR